MFLSIGAQGTALKFVDQNGDVLNNVVVTNPATLVPMSNSQTPAIMDQVNLQFFPHVLVISPGQAVSFPNRDDVRHHVYSFSKPQPFEIKLYKNTPTEPIVFNTPGVIELGCNIHDQMLGYIYVAPNLAIKSDRNGLLELPTNWQDSFNLNGTSANNLEVKVWHPRLSASRIDHKVVSVDLTKPVQVITLIVSDASHSKQIKGKTRFGKQF